MNELKKLFPLMFDWFGFDILDNILMLKEAETCLIYIVRVDRVAIITKQFQSVSLVSGRSVDQIDRSFGVSKHELDLEAMEFILSKLVKGLFIERSCHVAGSIF